MPAFRIVYVRDEASGPETVSANFENLEQALSVFATRGLRIVYIAETARQPRPLGAMVDAAQARLGEGKAPRGSSFPIRRFSARAVA
jgi:hypothetical protein